MNVFVDGRADPCLGLLFTPCVRFVFVGVPAVAAGVGFVASRFVPERRPASAGRSSPVSSWSWRPRRPSRPENAATTPKPSEPGGRGCRDDTRSEQIYTARAPRTGVKSTYRCLGCVEHTVTRNFDTSHLAMTCPGCESFERLVNEAVFEQYRRLEETPPESLEWEALDRSRKLLISEQLVRRDRSIEDFAVEA
jgi:hypothetical protein